MSEKFFELSAKVCGQARVLVRELVMEKGYCSIEDVPKGSLRDLIISSDELEDFLENQ